MEASEPTVPFTSEPMFVVIPNNNLNLRACASTECDRVGQVPGGTELPVYAVEGDWYQVQVDGELVWLAGWLTTRPTRTPRPTQVPDKLLETEEYYRDTSTDCDIIITEESGINDLAILLAESRRNDVEVALYRPNEYYPLPVANRRNRTFSDTGAPYLLQSYYSGTRWPNGLYLLEVALDGKSILLGWRKQQTADHLIRVYCDRAAAPNPTRTPRPTATPRPSSTPRPTVTPRPTRTPVPAPDKVLEPDEIYRDSNTGCEVLLDGEGYDGDLNIVLSGDRWNDVEVKIFRPGASSPLRVSDRFNDVFEDTGDPFIWQYYSVNSPWRAGLYRLEITLDGRTSLLAWRLERAGDQVIYVFCDGPAPRPTRTPRPTATRRPGPTSRPSITPRPTRTPRPTVTPPVEHTEIRTGALYRDEATGCNVLVLEFPPEQADWKDLWVIRDGELRHDFTVRVWLPDSDSPVPVEDEFDDTWDTGEPGVWQTYSPRTDWRNGIYRIEVSLGDASSVMTWRMERAAYYQVGVSCYQQAGPAPSV